MKGNTVDTKIGKFSFKKNNLSFGFRENKGNLLTALDLSCLYLEMIIKK